MSSTEMVPVNLFKPQPCTAEIVGRYVPAQAPGLFFVIHTDKDGERQWAYIGIAHSDLRAQITEELLTAKAPALAALPGELTICTAVIRNPEARSAAHAAMVDRLSPLYAPKASKPSSTHEVILKIASGAELMPEVQTFSFGSALVG